MLSRHPHYFSDRILRPFPASGPLTGHGGASESTRKHTLIRCGGFLPGVAALLARGGVGATAPTISPPHYPDRPARSKDFRKNPDYELRILEKSGSAAEDSEKSSARDSAISKNDRPLPPASKKSGTPLLTALRSAKKMIGPIVFKIDRGDRSHSSTITCVSTGISDETEWSVRSFSESIGPANFKIGRGHPQYKRFRHTPLPPLHAPQKK